MIRLEDILAELTKRQSQAKAVDVILADLPLQPDQYGRLKRGMVYGYVARQLGISVNNKLAMLVSDRMKVTGWKPMASNGTLYFKRA